MENNVSVKALSFPSRLDAGEFPHFVSALFEWVNRGYRPTKRWIESEMIEGRKYYAVLFKCDNPSYVAHHLRTRDVASEAPLICIELSAASDLPQPRIQDVAGSGPGMFLFVTERAVWGTAAIQELRDVYATEERLIVPIEIDELRRIHGWMRNDSYGRVNLYLSQSAEAIMSGEGSQR